MKQTKDIKELKPIKKWRGVVTILKHPRWIPTLWYWFISYRWTYAEWQRPDREYVINKQKLIKDVFRNI